MVLTLVFFKPSLHATNRVQRLAYNSEVAWLPSYRASHIYEARHIVGGCVSPKRAAASLEVSLTVVGFRFWLPLLKS